MLHYKGEKKREQVRQVKTLMQTNHNCQHLTSFFSGYPNIWSKFKYMQ